MKNKIRIGYHYLDGNGFHADSVTVRRPPEWGSWTVAKRERWTQAQVSERFGDVTCTGWVEV